MVSTFTTNKYIEKPGNNDYINNWNVPLNSDMDVLDAALGSAFSVSTINTNVYLTLQDARNQRIVIQGALTANVIIFIPFVSGSTTVAVGGMWIVDNQTTGAFTVTIKTVVTGSTGVLCGQGVRSLVFSNGNNCYYADDRVVPVALPQDLAKTSTTTQFASLGVGVAPSGTAGVLTTAGAINASGAITSTGNIIAYYSDRRLKEISNEIEHALETVGELTGYYYTQNKKAEQFGYNDYVPQVGLIAQEVQKVMPEAVKIAPFDRDGDGGSLTGENYLTIQYERLVPLLVQAINELHAKVKKLENK
jgi:hypothetical protein